jgi:hypothetical protein
MKKISILILLMSVLVFVSCDSSATQDISAVVENPTYNENIAPIMQSKCVSCHSGGDQSPNLETYNEVKEATLNGTVICRIEDSCGEVMPPSGILPSAKIAMINNWVTDGCPQ